MSSLSFTGVQDLVRQKTRCSLSGRGWETTERMEVMGFSREKVLDCQQGSGKSVFFNAVRDEGRVKM